MVTLVDLVRRIKDRARRTYLGRYARLSYSQEGEDLILIDRFASKASGFYVDIGAHHPQRFSNTYLLYQRGWRGINIDPMPGIAAKFQKVRPRDVSLELGIAKEVGQLSYYMFDDPALNGFDKALSLSRDKETPYRIIGEKKIQVRPLKEVLKDYLPPKTSVDVLTIDVEGLDLEVLQSNDWSLYQPTVLIVELRQESLDAAFNDPTVLFLRDKGYSLFACTGRSWFFERKPLAL